MALPILIQATPAQAGDTILTQRYNRLHRTDWPLFRGWWYKAIVVQVDRDLLALTRYIHRNPVDGPPQVRQLATYPWPSYPAFINQTAFPPWLEGEFTYGLLGLRRKYQAYQRYVCCGLMELDTSKHQRHTAGQEVRNGRRKIGIKV